MQDTLQSFCQSSGWEKQVRLMANRLLLVQNYILVVTDL